MTDDSASRSEQDDLATAEAKIREKLAGQQEIELTLQKPPARRALHDDDIEVVTATFRVPTSALLDTMTVSMQRQRSDPSLADNDPDDPATIDGRDPAI